MRAGDNTLNAWWAHWLTRYLLDNDEYHCEQWINTYVEHMTAEPPAHPDTYAESCHRGFFANMTAGKPLLECGAVTHDTPSMGALVTVAPLALALLGQDHSLTATCQICKEHVWLTHPDKGLMQVVEAYVTLMHHLRCKPWPANQHQPGWRKRASRLCAGKPTRFSQWTI